MVCVSLLRNRLDTVRLWAAPVRVYQLDHSRYSNLFSPSSRFRLSWRYASRGTVSATGERDSVPPICWHAITRTVRIHSAWSTRLVQIVPIQSPAKYHRPCSTRRSCFTLLRKHIVENIAHMLTSQERPRKFRTLATFLSLPLEPLLPSLSVVSQ